MTNEEQRELAIKCGAVFNLKTMMCDKPDAVVMFVDELAAYTAAVEATERMRCEITLECMSIPEALGNSSLYEAAIVDCIEAIKSLK